MNQAQIDRAESASEQLQNRRTLTQFRRIDAKKSQRDLVKHLLDNTENDLAAVEEHLNMYAEQAVRFEKYRQEACAFLIQEGVLGDDAAWRAYEAPVRRSTRLKASEMTFTDRQLEIARKSLGV